MSTVTPNPRRWWALALLCFAFFMVILDTNIVIVALPSIEEALSFSEQGLQWVISAYALTFAGLLLLGGRAADLLGRRRVFMVGLLFFTLASLLCGLAWSPGALIGARAFQGIGAAIMTPTALSIISTTFEGAERNKALAIWGMMGAFGATAGYLIAGPLVDGPGWEWIFFINVPIGLIALALCPVLLGESRTTTARRSYDPAGALTITGALILFVYALVEGPDAGWGSLQTIVLFAAAVALLAIFAVIESRHPAPLVPLRLLRSRTLVGANGVMLTFGAANGMVFILTLYAQQVLGYSALEFGASFVVTPVAAAAGMIVAQAAVAKVGFRPVAATGMALLGAGSLLLAQVPVGGSYFGDIFFGILVFGLGIGPAFATATIAALSGVAERESGVASGLSNTAFQIGIALGVAIVTTVAVSRSEAYLAANEGANPLVVLTEGFQSAFLACSVLAAIGVALALLLLGRPRAVPQERVELEMLAARRASPIPRLAALKQLAEEGGAADAA
ncbi:MAG: MFS transporter [Thermoleophilaceae bacterium]